MPAKLVLVGLCIVRHTALQIMQSFPSSPPHLGAQVINYKSSDNGTPCDSSFPQQLNPMLVCIQLLSQETGKVTYSRGQRSAPEPPLPRPRVAFAILQPEAVIGRHWLHLASHAKRNNHEGKKISPTSLPLASPPIGRPPQGTRPC